MLTKNQVEAAGAERIDAMIDGGLKRLDMVFSDDLLWVHASGVVDTKQSMLEQFSTGEMRCFSILPSDVTIRIFDDVAIMTGAIEMDAQVRGIRKTVRSRFTGVMAERSVSHEARYLAVRPASRGDVR